MVERGKDASAFARRPDVAGRLVLEADDETACRSPHRPALAAPTRRRSKTAGGSTVRQYENTRMMRAPVRPAMSNARRVRRGWSSNVYGDPNTSCWSLASTAGPCGSDALEQGRRDRRHAHPVCSHGRGGPIHLVVGQIDDVAAIDDAKLGASHPDGRHRVECDVEVEREFVGDGSERNREPGRLAGGARVGHVGPRIVPTCPQDLQPFYYGQQKTPGPPTWARGVCMTYGTRS